ncbi:hypothetical protein SEMRO_189_G081520.1 [Seminavis robusta]|uniref:Uncharacterized protein n=1 Tax=Seminavis robusta TaxID=568900 RepID=A0A9N8DKB9_9STRA|nr:hypothetical protein SEMRO_189_G081520.1 [Seminavis robusta]|eukprot:Sro189_g081520.1 n/a (389) ;mRNA; f:52617-53783
MSSNDPLVFDLSSLPLYPIDSTMADPSSAKTDSTMADPSSTKASATKPDTTMADPSSTKRKWRTKVTGPNDDFNVFRGIQTTVIKDAKNMHHQVDAAALTSQVLYTDENGKVISAVTVVMPSLICHQAFNKKYLGPPGNQPVVPWHQLPYKDDDDELKPITIQAFSMHTIALLAQHQCWVQAVVTTGCEPSEHEGLILTSVHDGEGNLTSFFRGTMLPPPEGEEKEGATFPPPEGEEKEGATLTTALSDDSDETVEPPDAGLMAMIKGQIDTFNANNKKEEKEERWVQGPLIPCPKLKEGQTLKITIRGPGDTEDTVLYVKAVAKKKDDGAEKDDGVGSKKDDGVGSKKDETEEASSSDSGEDIDSDCSYGEQEEEEEVDDSYKFCSI